MLPHTQLEEACADVLLSLRNEPPEGDAAERPEIQVLLVSAQEPTLIRGLTVRTPGPNCPSPTL